MKSFTKLAGVLVFAGFLLIGCGDGASVDPPEEKAASKNVSEEIADWEVGTQVRSEGGTFTRVSPEELGRAAGTEDFVLVNTHIPFERDLPGTDASIPFDEISDNLDRLPGKDERIVLYCQTGRMSDEAARTLVELGYTRVWDLGGGMESWKKAGYDLEGV